MKPKRGNARLIAVFLSEEKLNPDPEIPMTKKHALGKCARACLRLAAATALGALCSHAEMPAGGPPPGPPPDGNFGNGPGGGQPPPNGGPRGNADKPTVAGTAARELAKGKASVESLDLTASEKNQTALRVKNGASLAVGLLKVKKTGDTTSEEESNFYSLNAAVAVWSKSSLDIARAEIFTDAEGANAVFAWGEKALVRLKNATITTKKNSSRGLDATYGGTILGENLVISTAGAHCAALATDRGEGNVRVVNARAETRGEGSPGIYSTGDIRAKDSRFEAFGSEAAVIEGKNSITLENCEMIGHRLCGAMLYQSFSGDADVGTSRFAMKGGSLEAKAGALFFVTNTRAEIVLEGAELRGNAEDVLISAGTARWGRAGKNGGHLKFSAKNQKLKGDVNADDVSSVEMTLGAGGLFRGKINAAGTAGKVSLELGNGSAWSVAGTSSVDELSAGKGATLRDLLSRIRGNGHTVYYRTKTALLTGKEYALPGGGKLVYKAAPRASAENSGKSDDDNARGGKRSSRRNGGGNGRNGGNEPPPPPPRQR